MLSIYLGQIEQAIYYPPVYFNNTYDDEWITDPLTVEMIRPEKYLMHLPVEIIAQNGF